MQNERWDRKYIYIPPKPARSRSAPWKWYTWPLAASFAAAFMAMVVFSIHGG